MEANQFPAASRSICLIAVGKHTVTRRIQLSKRPCFTCLSKEVIARFSHAHNRTETCRRFASIPRLRRRRLMQMSRWRGRGVARRPSRICPKNACAACWAGQRNSVYDKKRTGFATRSTHTDATKRFFKRWPLRLLRENVRNCEALLFGAAGFLETPDLDTYKKSAREYVRQLWDGWWPHRDELQRFILPSNTWRLTSTRPLNHPQRRLAALAILARDWSRLQRASGKSSVTVANDFFEALEHPFWNFHYTLTSEASPKKMALIGDSRVADILANVLFPFWLAHDLEASTPPGTRLWAEYTKLPAQLSNRRLETAATRLFGNDPRRQQFLKTVAHQQGLLQIYEDFCMQDNSDCAQCPFPEQMRKWM